MAEFKYAKGRIAESLQFIMGELKEFEQDYAAKDWIAYRDDKKLQKLMDRTVENILTALIEVCGTVLTQEDVSVENYSQVLGECAKRLGLTAPEQENLAKLALQRNRLARRYLNFRWEAMCMFKEQRQVIGKILEKIIEREEKAK
jgi:uncharacterized protein YutE (UPF0331/DUF86 family)